jgi:cytidine deaminase
MKQFEEALVVFPSEIQSKLTETLNSKGMIPAELVTSWLNDLNIEIGTLMIQLLPVAASYARVPISAYKVGAVALGKTGSLYLGSNMEFTGEALSFCIHGEQSATNNAWLNGETGLQALAINAAPCGYCRQFLYELTTAKTLNILLKASIDPNDYSYTSNPLTYYLPDAFGPEDLGVKGGLMEAEAHGLSIIGGDATAQEALAGANACYSPYTYDFCSVAVKDANGQVYVGRYAENAAYNPSMSPLESSLAFMNMNLPVQSVLTITEAVLVEASSIISQKDVTKAVLSSIAPTISLEYYTAS